MAAQSPGRENSTATITIVDAWQLEFAIRYIHMKWLLVLMPEITSQELIVTPSASGCGSTRPAEILTPRGDALLALV